MIRIVAIAAFLSSLLAAPALACVAGTKCVSAPPGKVTHTYRVGDHLPRGKYQMLMNAGYYGLPSIKDNSRYFRVDRRVLRVRPDTLEVLEDVTNKANRLF